jgi:uncharacterized protein with WD repeat
MNTAEAIQHLKKSMSYLHSIDPIGKNLFKIKYATSVIDGEMITARELIKLAKTYSSENNQNTALKKNLKRFDKKKNHTATRDALKTEQFDKIPQHGKVSQDNIWNWD